MGQPIRSGDDVVIPWGLEEDRHGRVLSLFGPPGRQFARVEIRQGTGSEAFVEVVLLPTDLLRLQDKSQPA